MDDGRLSQPRYCSNGVQPIPKAVYYSAVVIDRMSTL